ncbi:MAG: thioredoxin domain-containing protein [Alphaproteobacteria bacterium]|nr:thioredoxin domain-containing protein [Alphaproteobacteria bacterium]MBU0797594.1 thioredoxin domain-containing protein [Alphaproteobacteria bacterium]MBU0886618.1 thioredoxin domain-containing protein [Alphaproteobacteria bacterium]MBU1812591.1 thioredoxin domain-containing protein [Alphaproteobacteria bacterium]MBU2091041.1 thioredoxin domain-containing protein [Alphaproteobacteria bacterium]
MTRKPLILIVLIVTVAIFSAAAWYVSRPAPTANSTPVAPQMAEALLRSYSPILGPKDAPVTIVEFFDPACEACRAFYPIVKDIMAEHGSAVRVAIRYTPFHGKASEEAIRILEAARMQDIFEPVLEALLRQQQRWASHSAPAQELLLQIAVNAGLDAEKARAQMLAPSVMAVLNQDRADVEAMGVRGTPTFFVNGKPLSSFGEKELRALVAAEVEVNER